MRKVLLLLFLIFQVVQAGPVTSQSMGFADADVGLKLATRKAQISFNEFKSVLNNPVRGLKDPQAKVSLAVTAHSSEQIWVSEVVQSGEVFVGKLTTQPVLAKNFARGQLVSFRKQDIVDWSYWLNNKLHGAFTLRISLPRMPPSQAAEWEELLAPEPKSVRNF